VLSLLKKGRRPSKFDRSIHEAVRKFESDEKRRELLIKDSRDVISFCSKAIVASHIGDFRVAKMNIENASEGLKKLRVAAASDLDRYIQSSEMEYVEATVFLALLNNREIPGLEEIGVKPSSYVLGLLDVVGELKRKVFDYVRVDKQREASRLFEYAESIYLTIKPLAIFDNLIPGMRRKLDVDRMLLEDMRGLMTEEVRRNRLLDSLNRVERKLGQGKISFTK